MTAPVADSATVGEALSDAAARLRAAGVDRLASTLSSCSPRRLGWAAPSSCYAPRRSWIRPRAPASRNSWLAARPASPWRTSSARKPFRDIELEVDPRVLIPRPETELLVEVGLTLPAGSSVVDVGTGSGAVALALGHERPDLEILATEISADAVAVARANAARLGLEVEVVQADLLTGIDRCLHAVLANLPYVADEAPGLAPEITEYEPAGALFAGGDGLDLIRRLIGMLDRVAVVALEVGFDQAAAVDSLLHGAGFESVHRVRDLAGHDRVLVGRRPGS